MVFLVNVSYVTLLWFEERVNIIVVSIGMAAEDILDVFIKNLINKYA